MIVLTTNITQLLEPGVRQWFGDEYKQHPEEYSRAYQMETSKKKTETDEGITGMGAMPQKPEGQPISYDTFYKGYTQTFTHTTFGMGISISREMFEDDLYRKMQKMSRGLAKSVRHTVEIQAATTFNTAFTSGTGADGQFLCDTDHTTVAGGNYRNELEVAADLDITSFETMLTDLHTQFIDDRGLKMKVMPKKMLIHPSNIWMAEKILKSAQEPNTVNNAINPGKGMIPQGYQVMHWFTDTDAWFVLTDVQDGMLFFWRRKPDFGRDNDFNTENARFKSTMRFSHGWTDPRGIFGSPGV